MDKRFALPLLIIGLSGCDQLGDQLGLNQAAKKEADARAIGGACRHANRAIETCYTLNPKVSKSAIYAGWRDMDTYMRENNIEPIAPQEIAAPAPPPVEAKPPKAPEEESGKAEEGKEAPDKKGATAQDEQIPPSDKFKKVAWPGRRAT